MKSEEKKEAKESHIKNFKQSLEKIDKIQCKITKSSMLLILKEELENEDKSSTEI
jgi:hypothetical protein